jgi:hypothetical protein
VRKKKGDTHEKDAALQLQLQQAAARQHFLEQNEESLLARSNSERQNPVTYPTRSGASFSSGSSDAGRHALPSLQTVNPNVSAIEKSTLRTYMDSKSDQIRNKLAAKFSPKPETVVSHSTRPGTAAAVSRGRSDPFVVELPSSPVKITSPVNIAQVSRPRVVKTNDALGLGLDGRIRPGEETRIKRWLGGGKPPQPWNKLRKVLLLGHLYTLLLANSYVLRTRNSGIQQVTPLCSLDMRRTRPPGRLHHSASHLLYWKKQSLHSSLLSSAKDIPTMSMTFPPPPRVFSLRT